MISNVKFQPWVARLEVQFVIAGRRCGQQDPPAIGDRREVVDKFRTCPPELLKKQGPPIDGWIDRHFEWMGRQGFLKSHR